MSLHDGFELKSAPDKGCAYATQKIGHVTKCRQCPFGDCVELLSWSAKQVVVKTDHSLATRILELMDFGINAKWLQQIIPEADYHTVKMARYKRKELRHVLKRYILACDDRVLELSN